jgi:hypothetical protein
MSAAIASKLRRWVRVVGYRRIRDSESAQSAVKPDGGRLRGVEVAPGIVLARDFNFYDIAVDEPTARLLTDDEVLQRTTLASINTRFLAAERRFSPTHKHNKK